MRRRSPARWLAPLALVACIIAVAAVLGDSLRTEKRSGASSPTTSESSRTVSEDRSSTSPRRKTYRVRSGDTLTSISVRTGVPLERLRALNPELDSDALQTGERIRLRR